MSPPKIALQKIAAHLKNKTHFNKNMYYFWDEKWSLYPT